MAGNRTILVTLLREKRSPRTTIRRRAFTLLELMVTLAILAATAVLVVPALSSDDRLRLTAASHVLWSDIELAQVMTMSYPQQPVVVKFDPDNGRYWLAYNFDPETPILRADGDPYEVVFGLGRASTAQGVTLLLDSLPTSVLEFNAQGGLIDFTVTPRVQLSHGSRAITLTVSPTTGTLTESEGTIEDAIAQK